MVIYHRVDNLRTLASIADFKPGAVDEIQPEIDAGVAFAAAAREDTTKKLLGYVIARKRIEFGKFVGIISQIEASRGVGKVLYELAAQWATIEGCGVLVGITSPEHLAAKCKLWKCQPVSVVVQRTLIEEN